MQNRHTLNNQPQRKQWPSCKKRVEIARGNGKYKEEGNFTPVTKTTFYYT